MGAIYALSSSLQRLIINNLSSISVLVGGGQAQGAYCLISRLRNFIKYWPDLSGMPLPLDNIIIFGEVWRYVRLSSGAFLLIMC